MFLPDGSPTGAIDSRTYAWTGDWPADRAPRIGRRKFSITAESGATPEENVFLPEAKLRCVVNAAGPEVKRLRIKWDLRVDVSDNPGQGGGRKPGSAPIGGAALSSSGSQALIQLPAKPGNYRIFVYAHDPGGKAAAANIPVLVKPAG